MLSLAQIEKDLTEAIKAKDRVLMDVLRGLKTRIINEQVAKMVSELTEEAIVSIVRSEVKKRKEAAESFLHGGRAEQAEKENKEAEILNKYLPAQMPEEELAKIIDAVLAENAFGVKDFGKAMGLIKARVKDAADGASISKVLKERLK